jgi:hypothetical protein
VGRGTERGTRVGHVKEGLQLALYSVVLFEPIVDELFLRGSQVRDDDVNLLSMTIRTSSQ